MNDPSEVQRFRLRLADPRKLQQLVAQLDADWERTAAALQTGLASGPVSEAYRFSRTIDNPGACGDPAVVTVELTLPAAQRDEFVARIRQRFRVEVCMTSA